MLAGAVWAGIAGFLKATVGAHEVISTIMLNWIAIWVGKFLFGLGGPLQNVEQPAIPISKTGRGRARSSRSSGVTRMFQGLPIGIFVAVAALFVYWIILSRTTLGYGVKAVGFNPEAARYGGINVSRNYFLAMAISGAFAGRRGSDWTSSAGSSDRDERHHGLHRSASSESRSHSSAATPRSASGSRRCSSPGSSTARRPGTSIRQIFQPELASNLTLLIQGLVVLFVGADMIVL